MHATSKVRPLSSTNDEQTNATIAYELPNLLPSHHEYTALRTHQLFCTLEFDIATDSKKPPVKTVAPIVTPTTATSKIHEIALVQVPKNIWHTISTCIRRLFLPLSNSISHWFSFSNLPSLKLYCQWAHQQMEHDIIMRIAQKMREENQKIEEENRLAAKKKTILQSERKKEDVRSDLLQYELNKLSR